MADPVSAGLMVASQLIGAVEQNGQLKRAARIDDENARAATLQGELSAQQSRRDELLAVGAGLASSASDGVALGTGTMADLIEQSALEREREIIELRIQAEGEAKNFRQSATDKRQQGNMALVNGVIGAASTVAGAVNQGKNQDKIDGAQARRRDSELGPQADTPARRTASAPYAHRPGSGWQVPRRRFGNLPGY